jgi:hypothetical protein
MGSFGLGPSVFFLFGTGGVAIGCCGKAVVATGDVEVLEKSVGENSEIYGNNDQVVLH